MNDWANAKAALAVGGAAVVLLADHFGVPRLGWVGLGLILAAFLLRFWQRAKAKSRNDSTPRP
jgi:predicted MFS family arabinose efflux permease